MAEAGSPRGDRTHDYKFGFGKVKVIMPSEFVAENTEDPPAAELQLYYGHGYNGNSEDSRQNLYLSKDKASLLYFTAAVVVKHNIAENTQQFYCDHNDDVTTMCLDPAEGSTLVASGQKDPKDRPGQGKDMPKIYVWDYETMKQVRLLDDVCWGKVARVQWSKVSGNLYSIGGDPDQSLKIWHKSQIVDKKGDLTPRASQPTTKEPMLGFVINPYGNKAELCDEMVIYSKRKFAYAKVEGEKEGMDKLKFSFKNVTIGKLFKDGEKAFTAATWVPNGLYVVGGASGNIYICDGANPLRCVKAAHSKAIGTLCFNGTHIVSSGFDKKLCKWEMAENPGDSAVKKPLTKKFDKEVKMKDESHDFVMAPRSLTMDADADKAYIGVKCNQIVSYDCKENDTTVIIDGHDGQIWGLASHPTENIYATGGYDNAVKLWNADTLKCIATHEFDLKVTKVRQEINSATWSADGQYIAFGSETSWVHVFTYPKFERAFSFQIPLKNKNSELEGVSYLRFSPDVSMLAVAHMDSHAYIFSVNPKGPGEKNENTLLKIWKPLKHTGAPLNVQWSEDNAMLKTFNKNYEVCHFTVDKKKKAATFVPNIPDPDTVKWAGDPLIAGWDTEGLYQDGWDGTDLNDATLTSDRKFVCSGDDFGCVRLHAYPAVSKAETANKRYYGHAEFVVAVQFLRDDSQLITVGGNDQTIFQWKLVRE